MSLPPTELDEIRRAVHDEMANIQDMTAHCGSYRFVCEAGGITFLSHRPVGRILREIPRWPTNAWADIATPINADAAAAV